MVLINILQLISCVSAQHRRGASTSPYFGQFAQFPANAQNIIVNQLPVGPQYVEYPNLGKLPAFNGALSFLPSSVSSAAVVVAGRSTDEKLGFHFAGKNPLQNSQMWSSSKSLMFPYLVSQASGKTANSCDQWRLSGVKFLNVVQDIVASNERLTGLSTNCLAASLKGLTPRSAQQGWLRSITGNNRLEYLGAYGSPSCLSGPLLSGNNGKVLFSRTSSAAGNNLISSYDLARVYSQMVHGHLLPSQKRIPGVSFSGSSNIGPVLGAMAYDISRFVDDALTTVEPKATKVSISSKVGWGSPSGRGGFEIVHTAHVAYQNSKGKQISFAYSIKVHTPTEKQSSDSMAKAVTDLLRRINNEEPLA
jgi:hypothetical protein